MVLYETQASFYMIHNSHLIRKPLKLEGCFHFFGAAIRIAFAFATFNFQVPNIYIWIAEVAQGQGDVRSVVG
jgi:hypothetical protein